MKRRMTWEDVVPFPGNPIYEGRLDAMRREWGGYDNSLVGSPAIFDNSKGAWPDLPEDALIVGDGNHRRELARQDGKLTEEFMADLHRGLSRAEMHRHRRGLNDRRTVKPAETFLELVEEGSLVKRALKDAVEGLGWEISYERSTGGLPYTNELEWIWKRDKAALVLAIQSYEQVWGRAGVKSQGRVLKGLGAFWIKYPDADMERLVRSLKGVSVGELHRAGKNQNDDLPFIRTVFDGIRYVLAQGYNKSQRSGKRLAI